MLWKKNSNIEMLESTRYGLMFMYEDKSGNLLTTDDVSEMSAWEIYQKGIHVYLEI